MKIPKGIWRIVSFCITLSAVTAYGQPTAEEQPQPEKTFPGISFYVLRVIYPESASGGVELKAYNKTDKTWLMQSWVSPHDLLTGDVLREAGKTTAPFVVTPPLKRLDAGDTLALRIRKAGDDLPKDRESVFFVSVKAIPPKAAESDDPHMTVTIVSNLKLFWRPDGLADRAVEEMAPKLRFTLQGNQLVANNPTPYWLTFSRLAVGKIVLDKPALRLMVPPMSERRYTVPGSAKGNVKWQLIDEDGWDTDEHQQPL